MKNSQIDLTHVLAGMLETNRGPSARKIGERVPPKYNSSLVYRSGEFVATLKFLAEESYCCMERGCHISVPSAKLWEALQIELSLNNENIPSTFLLKLTTKIEAGARFFDFSRPVKNHRGWYEFGAVNALVYVERFVDGVLHSDT